MSAFLLLAGLILAPALAALVASRARSDQVARRIAIGGAALTLLLALVPLALGGSPGAALDGPGPVLPFLGTRLRLGLDGYTVVLPALLAFLQLALLVAGKRAALDRPTVVALLGTASAILGVVCAADLAVMGVAWLASLLICGRLTSRKSGGDPLLRRTYRIYMISGAAPIAVVIGVLVGRAALHGSALPFEIEEIARVGVPDAWQPLLFALLGISALMRMGAVPFHGWLPLLLERGPLGVTMLLAEVQVGVCVLLRVAAPILPSGFAAGMPFVAALGLLSTLHGAVLALTQTDLRRMIGYMVTSQKGMVLLGIASMNTQSLGGALLQGVASAIALTGLAIVIWAVESRTGTADTRQLGGLVARTPRLTAFFFLLGCAVIGFPGALAFISEDLLLQGVLHVHPALAVLMLLGTAINGITLLRAFVRTFLGPIARDRHPTAHPLLFRERAVLLSMVALTVLLGVAPSRLIALREPVVDRLVWSLHH